MKILIVSDSHHHDEIFSELANKHPNCDYYLCLGDSESSLERISPFASVKGNCDFYSSDFPRFIELDTPIGKLYAEHIPFYQKNVHELKEQGYKIYLCGHTHIKKNEVIDDVLIINPGSVSYPRDDSSSYAILDISKDNIKINFFTLK